MENAQGVSSGTHRFFDTVLVFRPNEHISTKNPVYLNFGSRQKPKKFPWT